MITCPDGYLTYSTRPTDHTVYKAIDPAHPFRFLRVYTDGRWTAHASKYRSAVAVASGVFSQPERHQ